MPPQVTPEARGTARELAECVDVSGRSSRSCHCWESAVSRLLTSPVFPSDDETPTDTQYSTDHRRDSRLRAQNLSHSISRHSGQQPRRCDPRSHSERDSRQYRIFAFSPVTRRSQPMANARLPLSENRTEWSFLWNRPLWVIPSHCPRSHQTTLPNAVPKSAVFPSFLHIPQQHRLTGAAAMRRQSACAVRRHRESHHPSQAGLALEHASAGIEVPQPDRSVLASRAQRELHLAARERPRDGLVLADLERRGPLGLPASAVGRDRCCGQAHHRCEGRHKTARMLHAGISCDRGLDGPAPAVDRSGADVHTRIA